MLQNRKQVATWKKLVVIVVLVAFTAVNTFTYAAQQAECAEVKIVIKQKLSFERQSFDASMIITNGLSTSTLQDINIDLFFLDHNQQPVVASQDPNATDALFFYRTDSSNGITHWDGQGTIKPSSSADIQWLIIPAPGAAGSTSLGNVYYVGAKVTYTLDGKTTTVDVTPDYIKVKPLPELTLDYFLPYDVYGDDPFTPEEEPMIPFTLGVRVKNDGLGTSTNTQIESAQVKIIENKQGLLIDFNILASYVANLPVQKSLLIDLGDILPGTSQSGRWLMTTSLSGRFTQFDASFTHADTLGGALTSVIKAVNTHTLLQNVKVDLPGRDDVLDFLALDGDVLRLYESDGIDTLVTDQSKNTQLTTTTTQGQITFPATNGFVYSKINNPWAGKGGITSVKRQDGTILPAENIWLSQTRNKDLSWSYFINLFDVNSNGSYQFDYAEIIIPVLTKNIKGHIYSDLNLNDIQDNSEVGLAGLKVTLIHYDQNNNLLSSQAIVTDPQGNYHFDNLAPGAYSIEIRALNIVLSAADEAEQYTFSQRSNDSVDFMIKEDLSISVTSSPRSIINHEVK